MVIPWVGYSLSEFIKRVEPLGSAKYVEFITLADPKTMPGVASRVLDWPYVEGLRLDEAMHPLTLMATGLYGEPMPNQNGAPIRLVVPWKYGFKSIKAIVKITLTDKQPPTTWNKLQANEYGFYANVNPTVDHPRWSQASERRIGAGLFGGRVDTLMFNMAAKTAWLTCSFSRSSLIFIGEIGFTSRLQSASNSSMRRLLMRPLSCKPKADSWTS